MTLGITVALTAYACLTDKDMTMQYGAFVTMFFCLFFFFFIGLFVRTRWMEIAISAICVFFYGIFIIVDTQEIAGGKRYKLSTEDYVIGALCLYIDIMRMFVYVLRILGSRR